MIGLKLNSTSRVQKCLFRLVAVFILIYTGADLAMPQYFCGGDEIANLPIQGIVLADETDAANEMIEVGTSSSHDSEQRQSPTQVPHEEDCFCCCAHVLPGLIVTQIAHTDIKTLLRREKTDRLLSPPLPNTYHPPRFV